METQEIIKMKQEPEDYVFEYRGAPSPDVPIYGLMPLSSILPEVGANSSKENGTEHTFEKKHSTEAITTKTDEYSILPNTSHVPENEQSKTELDTANKVKTFKDASTNTSICVINTYCEHHYICVLHNQFIRKSAVREVRDSLGVAKSQKSEDDQDRKRRKQNESINESEVTSSMPNCGEGSALLQNPSKN